MSNRIFDFISWIGIAAFVLFICGGIALLTFGMLH